MSIIFQGKAETLYGKPVIALYSSHRRDGGKLKNMFGWRDAGHPMLTVSDAKNLRQILNQFIAEHDSNQSTINDLQCRISSLEDQVYGE